MTQPINENHRGVTAADGTTKARIERAAVTLFLRKGIEGATTREIASHAGISEGALYRHFKGKEEIAQHLFAEIHDRLAALVRNAGSEKAKISDQVSEIVQSYCETADDDWVLFAYHLLSIDHFLPTPPGRDDPVSATEEIIKNAMDGGEIPNGDVALTGAMVLGVVLQPALHKAYGRLQGPLSMYVNEFNQNILAILQSSTSKER